MSKIGRMPIPLGNVKVEIAGQEIHYKGPKAEGSHELSDLLQAKIEDNKLVIQPAQQTPALNRIWGLHRALLANKVIGADQGFERKLQIVGLGYKGLVKGDSVEFSLGYSHKIDFPIPDGVSVETNKPGQLITLKSSDKELLGLVASKMRALRPPEPYKGSGIRYEGEKILRKEGKAK
jgi:large subunit ribosomal protein L6